MSLDVFLFLNICFTALTLFVIIYSYTLKYYGEEIQKKWKQEKIVGLTILFLSMITCFFGFFIFILLF